MFNFLRKKEEEFGSPVTGELIKLENVDDDIFSKKMIGDGFAVKPLSDARTIVSPVDGKIIMIPATKHAIGIKIQNGIEVLVHIGLDTVNLQGEGFNAKIKKGDKVKRGQELVIFDNSLLKTKGYNLTTMVLFVKGFNKAIKLNKPYNFDVKAGECLITQ